MSTNTSLLPKEATALVHNIELNRAGWWDKTVHRLVLAAIWLSDHTPNADEIQATVKAQFRLSLNKGKLSSVLSSLEAQSLLVRLQDDSYRIPDKQRAVFEQEIAAAEKVASDARDFFFRLVTELCTGLSPQTVWAAFDSEYLSPLIKEVGANTYRLIAGERMNLDKQLFDRFLSKFGAEFHSNLTELITQFLDPKKDEVRAHVSRMLHASFCVEASGLTQDVIQKLSATMGKQICFRVFVDTNFLFSILALHENPSNTAASELQELISQLKSNPKVELYVLPRTIKEVKTSISSAKFQLSGIPAGLNFTHAALRVGFSGMIERFLTERLRRGGNLTPEEWFDPYLDDFVPIARGKGVELFNEKIESYATRQDVVDDISLVRKFEEKLPPSRRKSYEKVEHDMILWHVVNDKRSAYIESPIDARDWILTVDFRLIGFDEHKYNQSGARIPLCLHPTSLIQLLQFWVPRTKEFDEAVLGSLRLPFLFQEFDADAERTSLKILKGLGRFEGANDIPEQAITHVILNDGLRTRLKTNQPENVEVALIRDALVEEVKVRADAEADKARQLQDTVKQREAAITTLDAEKRAKEQEIEELKTKVSAEESRSRAASEKLASQGLEIDGLKSKWLKIEASKERRFTILAYFGVLTVIILFSGFAGWWIERALPWSGKIIGTVQTRVLIWIVVFVIGHLLFESWARGNERMNRLWPFKQISRFRGWLWTIVVVAFVGGVVGNLVANRIQKNLDKEQQPVTSPQPRTVPGKQDNTH